MHKTLAIVLFVILVAAVNKTNANISLGACTLSCNENEHQAHDMLGVATQGAPGKHGPMGPKGLRGFKGDPGARGVPGQSCECSDREEFTAKMVALQAQIDGLKALCPVIYDNKCFIAVIDHHVNYDDGVAVCKSRGGHLANIYNQTHMDDVMKYIRGNRMGGSSIQWFRLGMKYDPKVKKLTFRDSTDAPAGLKWYPGAPYNVETNGAAYADYTSMNLRVESDQSSSNQYLYNTSPSISYYVVCEIE